MQDQIALHEHVPTTGRKARRLKRGICALAAAMTIAPIAGGTALFVTSASSAVAAKTGVMATPMGNSWR
jgi:hypothetical protein